MPGDLYGNGLAGLGLGLLIVYAANIARIIALFFAATRDRPLFSLLHGYLSPIALAGVGVLFFALWLAWTARDGAVLEQSSARDDA